MRTRVAMSRKSSQGSRSTQDSEQCSKALVLQCVNWSIEEVADWVESLGFPQYRDCFTTNMVSGRRLIWVTASTLPRMGITDWKHVKHISSEVRGLLQVEEPYWNRSITLPRSSELSMFLEKKSFTGQRADQLQFEPVSEHETPLS